MRTRSLDALGFDNRFIAGADRALMLLIYSANHGTPDLLDGGRALAPGVAVRSLSEVAAPEQHCQFCRHNTCDVQRQARLLADFVTLAAQSMALLQAVSLLSATRAAPGWGKRAAPPTGVAC